MKKRERGEDEGCPHGKRAAGPRAESSEAANQPATGQRLTTDDALAYLKAVKEKFKDDKEKYDEFLEVMKDFKAQKIDTAGVITRVKELFKGHRNLILGFNTFLPKGYEITLPLEEEKKQPAVEFDQAINYVNKIKARFQTDEQVYKAFLEILNMYRKGNKSINEVYQEVASLFENHGDLLEEFTYFLPGSTGPPAMTVTHPVAKPVHQNSRQRDDKPLGVAGKQPGEKLLVPKREKSVAVHGERDRDRDPERRAEKDRKKGEKEREKKDMGKERVDRDDGAREKEKDLDAMRLPHKRKSARRADELIRKQSQAGEGGEGFQGPGAPLFQDEKKLIKSGTSSVQYPFFDKVKSRLRSPHTYQEFLKCLNIFSQEIISRGELQSLVGDILGKHADLMEGFNEFLTHCENVEGYLAGVFSGRKLGDFGEEPLVKAVKVEKEKERDRDRDREKDRERERDRDHEKERDKERDRDTKAGVHPVKEAGHKGSIISSKDKYINKPVSELDLSSCERCTPSYRLLPKNYPRPLSSHRTALGNAVLNDNWVSVTSGSEDYSFKHMRKNQYEESLFRCEDDRFELDMLLESTAATAKLVGEYSEKHVDANVKQESPPGGVGDYLSAINMRCIERIYGDHGLDIIDVLRKNTSKAMPVIHTRLKQKQEEWTRCRIDMNKVWAEVYAKNYYKALDHRSFYFRQQDKKSLSTRGLLAEIKEVNERKRREDDTMLAIAAGNRRPLCPDLQYDYLEPSIHEDLYQIIKYSSEEVSTSTEQTDKIMRIWTTFLEPMFGIPPRPHGLEDMGDAAKWKVLEPKESGTSAHASGASEGVDTPPELGTDLKALVPMEEFTTATSSFETTLLEESGTSQMKTASGEAWASTSVGQLKQEEVEAICTGIETVVAGENPQASGAVDPVSSRPSTHSIAENIAVVPTRPNVDTSAGLFPQSYDRMSVDGTLAKESVSAPNKPENEGRSNASAEGKTVGSKPEGLSSLLKVDFSGILARGEREEGELSPSPELEERNKLKFSSGQRLEENGLLKESLDDEEDGGVVGTEIDHDRDADDEGDDSAQKSSEDSDNASEAAEEVSESESGDEQSEHEEEEEEEEDEQEGKAESEGEAEGMVDADDRDGDGNSSLASPDQSFVLCKPLAAHTASAEALVVGPHLRKDGRILYGNDLFYVLFRLHQTLYWRVLSAKENAALAEEKWKKMKDTPPPNLYARFKQVLYSLLDGSVDNSKYEDECRALIGTQSYVLFTLDKLIFKLVKQLQAAATDDVALKLLALHAYEKAGETIDLVYHANACVILHDENIYRIEHRSNPSELLIQLMEGGPEKLDFSGHVLEVSFQSYLDEFFLSAPTMKSSRVFMSRNKRRKFAHEDADEALQNAMENVTVMNGLEYKISCHTSKVSYVLDTEDLFLRCSPLRTKVDPVAKKLKEKRECRRQRLFNEWIDQRTNPLSNSKVDAVAKKLKEKQECRRQRLFNEWIDQRTNPLGDSVSQSETSQID